ncbi:hypothetical protein [Cryptosporangium arvum]|uniref:Uncharacterized protein n=1 Tax=Cryptosporangium arvum DSM 44712 TaxID=927661 RepID=A0A010ZML5_9ACTN|nr:hypothetical protein [Cryptosporangium arvum]EXG79919.1 hypothetical protein CryarDRAFT_0971 [Cryptosporangium arvum DSM 44712]
MSHLPVDHPLRGLYRGLTIVTGAASIAFGATALATTSGNGFTDPEGEKVWGLMAANPAAGVLWIVVGAIAVLAALAGRNIDAKVNSVLGPVLWVVGTIGLCLIRGENNFLAWSVTNVCVMYLLGTLWFTAALYSGVSGSQPVSRPEAAGRVAEEALGAAK